MIGRLSISNYLLIEQLDLEWYPGLNIITGETGAGKSILMDALGLLAGDRADPKCLRNPEKKCSIEAWFRGENSSMKASFEAAGIEFEVENILRREILPGGKSRAFINDSPVTLDVLRQLSVLLFDIHGQQDSLLLGNQDVQFRLLDVLAGSTELQEEYHRHFLGWKEKLRRLEQARKNSSDLAAELDYKSYLFRELEEAALQEGEQESAEARLQLQRNAGDIAGRLQQAHEMLEGRQDMAGNLKQLSLLLGKVASMSPELESLAARLSGLYLEAKDIASEISSLEQTMEFNPEQQQTDEERLSRIYQLQKKHRLESVSALLKLQTDLGNWLQQNGNPEELVSDLEKQCMEIEQDVLRLDSELQQKRMEKLESISRDAEILLADMAMPAARFIIRLTPGSVPGPFGTAGIRYLFSANPGMPETDLKNAASGGEFSRVMLALKCLMASKTEMPSLIFDEIDTGISGEVAMRVGKIIRQMAGRHQVLVITHSAQMASRAEAHWKVEKVQESHQTETRVRLLNKDESIKEIATIISGHEPGKAALEAARELLNA
jgi:DNA repair protein RecN (Recombination protein N)